MWAEAAPVASSTYSRGEPIRATYRPVWGLTARELPRAARARAGPEVFRIPGFDEDEATMAVAAAQALLEATRTDPTKLTEVQAGGNVEGWGPVLSEALGIPPAWIRKANLVELRRALEVAAPETPGQGLILYLQTVLGRPGTPELETEGRESSAVARLVGPGIPTTTDLDLSPNVVHLDPATYQKLAEWERWAPQQVSRAAHVPAGTWDRSRAARYRLLAGACPQGHRHFPASGLCPECGKKQSLKPLARRGSLESYTIIAKGTGPTEFDPLQEIHGEYGVGVAEFDGTRVPGMICDTALDQLRVGLPVEPVFRRLYAQDGAWRYGTKLRAPRSPVARALPTGKG